MEKCCDVVATEEGGLFYIHALKVGLWILMAMRIEYRNQIDGIILFVPLFIPLPWYVDVLARWTRGLKSLIVISGSILFVAYGSSICFVCWTTRRLNAHLTQQPLLRETEFWLLRDSQSQFLSKELLAPQIGDSALCLLWRCQLDMYIAGCLGIPLLLVVFDRQHMVARKQTHKISPGGRRTDVLHQKPTGVRLLSVLQCLLAINRLLMSFKLFLKFLYGLPVSLP